jgi:3-oxoacyl-[acyl-carrier protein] reductase
LTKSEDTSKLFNKIIEEEGHLDICIANAGNYPNESLPLWDIDDKRWNETVSTNLSITFNTSREFLKHVSQTKKGSLVLVGSTAGIYGEYGHSDYAAAKGAITSGLLKTLINAVAPGWTATQKKIDEGLNQNHVDRVVSTMALKKLATPEDVANTIVILASDSLSGHTTGQVVEIAGGMEGRQITGIK